MNHSSKIIDADKHFEIDPITRSIRNQSPTKISIIQYDHNSERFSFELPRMIEGHDMMECNRVEVHYINNGTAGVYEVDDLAICEDDNAKVCCSWLLSQNATGAVGALTFLLRFACVDNAGNIEYAWNTAIFKGISVAEGLYNSETIVEQYADVLEQWKKNLGSTTEGTSNSNIMVVKAWQNPDTGKIVTNTDRHILYAWLQNADSSVVVELVFGRSLDDFTLVRDVFYLRSWEIGHFEFVSTNRAEIKTLICELEDDEVWTLSKKTLATKEELDDAISGLRTDIDLKALYGYIDTQIGDIETSLDNVASKYGLGGDAS